MLYARETWASELQRRTNCGPFGVFVDKFYWHTALLILLCIPVAAFLKQWQS